MTRRLHRRNDIWRPALIVIGILSFALGLAGFLRAGPPQDANEFIDRVFSTIRLFSLNFDMPANADWQAQTMLQAARIGAFVTTIWALLKALFPQALHRMERWRRGFSQSCVVVLGYGPIGQAIAAGLKQPHTDVREVTAVHPVITADLAARARMDGVLLVEGDPSDPGVLTRVHARKARRIYISDPDDLRAIDTAVALRAHLTDPKADVRIVLNDSAVAAQMAEAAGAGFLGVPGLRWFSLADEAARSLIAEARFDRVAGAKRLHLVILGCGSQGEAIAVETLLTGWRTALGPPRITFLDKDASGIKARMRRRMPAWFVQPDGKALPEGARPELKFLPCNAETLDFARDACLDGLREGVTGWVFATGNDALNLRASLSLHRAISMRQIDPAPIYVRIPSGHAEDAPDLVGQPISMARTFGAIDSVVARSAMLSPDPDALPKKLHAAYAKASVEMKLATSLEDWASLPESKRNANRALFRHAVMKIEDFGIEAQPARPSFPAVDPSLKSLVAKVDQALDYARIDATGRPDDWLLPGMTFSAEEARIAIMLRDAAVCEHNRWTVERALEQFLPTETPDAKLRDDVRRFHNNMQDWYALSGADIRRYDVVLLRALLSVESGGRAETAKKLRPRTLFLPVGQDGLAGPAQVSPIGAPDKVDVTELRAHLCVAKAPRDLQACAHQLMATLQGQLDPQRQILPRRLRFDFSRPPGEATLALANMLAEKVRASYGSRITIEPLWAWKAAAGPVIGVVGHRDLTGFGQEAELSEKLRQTFMALAADRRAEGLIGGYAPGADQLAVKAWNALGLPPPRLVFPFADEGADRATVYHTDDPTNATTETAFPKDALGLVGKPSLPDGGIGHDAQAATILARAEFLVAVVDETREALRGGTVETVTQARAAGKEVIVIAPGQAESSAGGYQPPSAASAGSVAQIGL